MLEFVLEKISFVLSLALNNLLLLWVHHYLLFQLVILLEKENGLCDIEGKFGLTHLVKDHSALVSLSCQTVFLAQQWKVKEMD